MSNAAVARKLQITRTTVGQWRERFREFGCLLDEPRAGAPRKITDQQIEDVITKTLESMPHWSSRLMAEEAGLTQKQLRIWRAFGLQLHKVITIKYFSGSYWLSGGCYRRVYVCGKASYDVESQAEDKAIRGQT